MGLTVPTNQMRWEELAMRMRPSTCGGLSWRRRLKPFHLLLCRLPGHIAKTENFLKRLWKTPETLSESFSPFCPGNASHKSIQKTSPPSRRCYDEMVTLRRKEEFFLTLPRSPSDASLLALLLPQQSNLSRHRACPFPYLCKATKIGRA